MFETPKDDVQDIVSAKTDIKRQTYNNYISGTGEINKLSDPKFNRKLIQSVTNTDGFSGDANMKGYNVKNGNRTFLKD